MSYDEKLLREFIRHAMGGGSNVLNEELKTAITVSGGGALRKSIGLQSYREKYGVDRADSRRHPWMWLLGLGSPVEDLWDNFFGPPGSAGNPGGGWFYSAPNRGNVSQTGANVVNGVTQGLPSGGGAGWATPTASAFPNSAEVLSGSGRSRLSEMVEDEEVFEDEEEMIEDQEVEIDFTEFSAAVNNDLHTLVRGVENVQESFDAVEALEKFNEMFGITPSLSELRRDFEDATDDDIDKQALLDLLTQDVVPNFVSHVMDVGVGNMIANLDFTSRQVGELESLLAQSKMRL